MTRCAKTIQIGKAKTKIAQQPLTKRNLDEILDIIYEENLPRLKTFQSLTPHPTHLPLHGRLGILQKLLLKPLAPTHPLSSPLLRDPLHILPRLSPLPLLVLFRCQRLSSILELHFQIPSMSSCRLPSNRLQYCVLHYIANLPLDRGEHVKVFLQAFEVEIPLEDLEVRVLLHAEVDAGAFLALALGDDFGRAKILLVVAAGAASDFGFGGLGLRCCGFFGGDEEALGNLFTSHGASDRRVRPYARDLC